jgi:transcriptional regulator with XRE-family HTH domain
MLFHLKKIKRNFVVMIRSSDKEGLLKLGLHIKKLRTNKTMSQEDLAYAADVSLSQISRIELGKHNTTFSTLLSICKAMNITISDFFDGFEYPELQHSKRK